MPSAIHNQLAPIRRLTSVPKRPNAIFKFPSHTARGILKPSSLARKGVLSRLKSYLNKYTFSGYENNTDVDELANALGLGAASTETRYHVDFNAPQRAPGVGFALDSSSDHYQDVSGNELQIPENFEAKYRQQVSQYEKLQAHCKKLQHDVEVLKAEASDCLHLKLQVVNFQFLLQKTKLDNEKTQLGLIDEPVLDLMFYTKMHHKLNEYRNYLGAFDYYYQTAQESRIRQEYNVEQLEAIKPVLTKLHHKLTTNFYRKKRRLHHSTNSPKLINHLSVIHWLQVDLCHVVKSLDEILVMLKSAIA